MQRPPREPGSIEGDSSVLAYAWGGGGLVPLLMVAVGAGSRAHQQRRSGQREEQQARHRVLLGLVSRVWALSAVGDCLGDKGLNGLLGPAPDIFALLMQISFLSPITIFPKD